MKLPYRLDGEKGQIMSGGVNKSKIASDIKSYRGRPMYPHYERRYNAPSAKQIAYLKSVWQILSDNGYEYSFDRRALIEQHKCGVEINRAYTIAKKMGISLDRRDESV